MAYASHILNFGGERYSYPLFCGNSGFLRSIKKLWYHHQITGHPPETQYIGASGSVAGVNLPGFGITTPVWTDLSEALHPVSNAYSGLDGIGRLEAKKL